jgi:N6-L-threonylcarbamoyladenine synthase
MSYILGAESTCDDSSLGLFDTARQSIVWHKTYSQDDLHGKFGGVVPEIASRGHLAALPLLVKQLFSEKKISYSKISAFAVSMSPGLIGSLLVGINFMRSFAWSLQKPILGVDHLEAHLLSVLLEKKPVFPYLCFLLSGGHTMAIFVNEVGKYELLGKTTDDALGESFDKVAKILGFEYPGGPVIEKLANLHQGDLFTLPIPLKNRQDYDFSYSGLKTAVKRLASAQGIHREKQKLISFQQFCSETESKEKKIIIKLAASFQKVAFESLLWNFQKITKKKKIQVFSIAGGVANNRFITTSFQKVCEQKNIQFLTPKKEYCSDNGAMIAFSGYLYQKYKISRPLSASSKSSLFSF